MDGIDHILAIAWDESLFDLKVFKDLEDSNYRLSKKVFSKSNPDLDDLLDYYNETKGDIPQLILGLGGGSVMDLSKSLCMVYEKDIKSIDDIRDLIESGDYSASRTKWIGIPTTAGTGSEVTYWATIWDPKMNKKRSVSTPLNYAYMAIVDPQLLKSQPMEVAISSAIDAVSQSVEAYWSKKTNVVTRSYALSAITLIMENIQGLIEGDLDLYDPISQASLMSGLAFSNTQTTACHAISYPLTMNYNISHGIAVGLLLGPVMYYNEPTIINKKELFKALDVKSTDQLYLKVKFIFRSAGIPPSLKGWGIEENDLEKIADLAYTPGIFDNNPVSLSKDDVLDILKLAY